MAQLYGERVVAQRTFFGISAPFALFVAAQWEFFGLGGRFPLLTARSLLVSLLALLLVSLLASDGELTSGR